MVHEFLTSELLHQYMDTHITYKRCGDVYIGSLTYIDSSTLHVVFDSQKDFELWKQAKQDVQITLF